MKRQLFTFLLIICLMINFSGCSWRAPIFMNSEDLANDIIYDILTAAKDNDSEGLMKLFSKNVREMPGVDENIPKLFDMLNEEIAFCSDASDGALITSQYTDYGRIQITIQATFIVETTAHKYHIAIKYCTIDTFELHNKGLQSINIVNDLNWDEKSLFKWDDGITFGANRRR